MYYRKIRTASFLSHIETNISSHDYRAGVGILAQISSSVAGTASTTIPVKVLLSEVGNMRASVIFIGLRKNCHLKAVLVWSESRANSAAGPRLRVRKV